MVMFLSLFVLCAVCGYFANTEKQVSLPIGSKKTINIRVDDIYLAGFMLVMLLICGLRAISIGVDTNDYVSTFLLPDALESTVNGETKYEIGYVLFVKFLRLFGENYHVYIFATAAVMFIGVYFFIRSNCKGSYAIALLVYVAFLYYINFSAIRQAMALSVAINCIQFLKNKNWIPAILIILLGASFQTTSLLLLVMVPFAFTTRSRLKVIISIGLSLFGMLLFEPAVGIILKIFPIYERYWNSEMMQGEGGIGIFAILVIMLSVFATVQFFREKVNFENRAQRNKFVLALVGSYFTIAINLVGRKYGIFSRMTRYFIPLVMLLAADVYKYCVPAKCLDINSICSAVKFCRLDKVFKLEKYCDSEKYPKLAKCRISYRTLYYCMVAALMLVYFYTIMKTDLYEIIPYSFFFVE